MPTLSGCKQLIDRLAINLGWGRTIKHFDTKLWYAVIELGEAGDLWKHREDAKYLREEHHIETYEQLEKALSQEIIDVIFYCLHALQCLNPNINPDAEFMDKWRINAKRKRIYIDDAESTEE